MRLWYGADAVATCSIVAVHGLNPFGNPRHAETTWTAANKKLWLRDFLPQKLAYARILLFGYNSSTAFGTSTGGLIEQANSLMDRLKNIRQVQEPTIKNAAC